MHVLIISMAATHFIYYFISSIIWGTGEFLEKKIKRKKNEKKKHFGVSHAHLFCFLFHMFVSAVLSLIVSCAGCAY